MACIGCGLALNADGKGRVELDTEGGLECSGIGDGGTVDSAGVGLAVKVDPASGNSLEVGAAGVFVPPAYRFETNYATQLVEGLADPGFGAGGSTYVSPTASFTLTNTTDYAKVYLYQGAVYYGSSDVSDPYWIELATSEGGGFGVPSAQYLNAQVNSPLTMLPTAVTVPANSSVTLSARAVVYRGNYASLRVSIQAWGGYA